MAFKITYSMTQENMAEIDRQFDEAVQAVRARLGQSYPALSGYRPIAGDGVLENRSPSDTRVILSRHEKTPLGRIDEIINHEIRADFEERGVIRISGPEGLFFTTIEYEENLVLDFVDTYLAFENTILPGMPDSMKAKLPSNRLHLPYNMQRLVIGDWQQLVFFTTREFESIVIELEFIHSSSILGLESIYTTAELQTLDVTDVIERTLQNSHGEHVTMISPSSSVALYALDPAHYPELLRILKSAAPDDKSYRHTHSWENREVAFTHLRASLIGQSLTIPTSNGRLDLGPGERVYLTELDLMPSRRDIYFEVWK